jgi:hypothetical protein
VKQQKRDPVMEHLRERVVLGLYPNTVLSLAPEQALVGLGALWEELRDAEQRRDKLILLGWLSLAILQTTACVACTRGYSGDLLSILLVSAGFTSPLPLIFLCRRRKTLQSCREAIRNTADQASGQDCVGPLLDLMAMPGLKSTHFRLTAALARLLPRVTLTEACALTEVQRATLCKALTRRGADVELVIAGLLVLGAAKDAALTEFAQTLAHSDKDERLSEAAAEYLQAVG